MRSRGFALITALSFALVCFVIASVMVAMTQFELRSSSGRLQQARHYFLARGQVHELLALIRNGAGLESHTELHPWVQEIEGVTITAWVVRDSSHPEVYHVRARAGRELSEVTASLEAPESGSAYTGNLGATPIFGDYFPARFLVQSGIGGWTPIPDPPLTVHTAGGGAPEGDFIAKRYLTDDVGHLIIMAVSRTGANVGIGLHRYHPPSDDPIPDIWRDLGPVPKVTDISGTPTLDLGATETEPLGGPSGELWAVTRSGAAFFDGLNYPGGGGASVLRRFRDSNWILLSGPPAWRYQNDGTLLDPTVVPGSGWIAALAGKKDDGVVAVVSDASGSNPRNVVASYDESADEWHQLPPVPKQYFDSNGILHSPSGQLLEDIQSVAVGPDDEIYVTANVDNNLTVLKLEDGGWAPLPLPEGTPPAAGPSGPHTLSVQSDGAVVLRSAVDPLYSRLADGEWSQLPRAAGTGETPWSCIGGAAQPNAPATLVQRLSR